jgi:Fe-S cluster biogenesis protein NfuA
LTQALLDMHRSGLTRMLAALERGSSSGDGVLDRWLDEPLVGNLLVLHDLHPLELGARVARALDVARERLSAQGADVLLLAIDGESVRLRLTSHSGCPSAVQSLRAVVVDALLERAADVSTVTWDDQNGGRPTTATLVPLASLTGAPKLGAT